MIETIIEKYAEIIENENPFLIKLKPKKTINQLRKELQDNKYDLEIIEEKRDTVRIRVSKNLYEKFLETIDKYKEGIVPEDIKYSEGEY